MTTNTGYAPDPRIYANSLNSYGTQTAPLNSFSVDGRTGNKTTNKDLPAWLRAIGMKGDAYAGGMLKPEIRYGFAYKKGQIHFADGTSFAATKNKDGTYSYTDGSGQATTYSPTDEQNSYNKKYQNSTKGFFGNFTESLNPLNHKSPFGEAGLLGDPLHYALGSKYDNVMRQTWEAPNTALSPYVKKFNVLDREVNPLHRAVDRTSFGMAARNTVENKPNDVIGAIIGGGAIAGGLGGGAAGGAGGSSIAPGTVAANTAQASATLPGIGSTTGFGASEAGGLLGNSGLGVFANGGAAGLAGVGGGNAGALAGAGGIGGGAGIGGTTGGALGGASGIANGISGVGGGAGAGGNMGWGDWVNLAGSLYGAYAQGQGAKNASNAEQAGIQSGINEQARQFDISRADQMPWLQSGAAALNRLNDPNAFTQSPGYAFTRNEALNGVQNSAAARGGLFSGNAGRALEDRAANLASTDYNNWFNQQSNLAGLGQTSAQSLGALGQNNANNVSNLLNQQGNARASGIEGQTNALTGGISDFLSWYNRRKQGGG